MYFTMPINEEEVTRKLKVQVRKLRSFYSNVVLFVFSIFAYLIYSFWPFAQTSWFFWIILLWGIMLILRGISLTSGIWIYSKDWEERKYQQLYNRYLNKDQSTKND